MKIMGKNFKFKICAIFTALMLCFAIMFSKDSLAQNSSKQSPNLTSIISSTEYFNDKTSDDKAQKIADKLYSQYLKANKLEKFYKDYDVFAKVISIQAQGSKDIFIVSQIMEPPMGCYAKGCTTFIYRSTNGKSWSTVFAAHLRTLWYDQSSQREKPANLIASSDPNNKKPGVWMWNNGKYFLANRRGQ